MNNYEMVASWVTGGRVLDYGCGAGHIVALLRERGIDAHGCDVFYEGGDYSKQLNPKAAKYVKRMDGDSIPHPDASFDVVVSNQVLEHVPDLERVSSEIARVLKPGGLCIHCFPDRSVWREGHCGIPFLHRFAKGSRFRVYYATALRILGMGHNTAGRTARAWSENFCRWLDAWTYYRSRAEIERVFARDFHAITHREELWFDARIGVPCPAPLKRLVIRKLAGMVIFMSQVDRVAPVDTEPRGVGEIGVG